MTIMKNLWESIPPERLPLRMPRNRRQFEHCNRHERLGWGGCVPIGEIVRTSFGQEVGRGGGRHGGIGDSLYGVWRLTQCITDESVYTGSV